MLVFLVMLLILYILTIIIYFSKIKIEINTFQIEKEQKLIIKDFKIKLFLVFGKLKWLKLEISKQKLDRSKKYNLKKIKEKLSSFKIKGTDLSKDTKKSLEVLKSLRIDLDSFKLIATIGLNSIITLSYLVAILDIIFSVFLTKNANRINNKEYKYVITPYKTSKVYLNLSINCIFNVKTANIINIILKKRGKKDGGASNRVLNGNSHEQYTRHGRCKYNNRRTNIYR